MNNAAARYQPGEACESLPAQNAQALQTGQNMTKFDFDLFVIGAGSGSVRSPRVAASLGNRVAIAEEYRLGGCCVFRGCVPKKLYVYASQFPEHFADAAGYGWSVGEATFDWPTLVANKEKEITRLEGLYRKGLENAGAHIFQARAVLLDRHTVQVGAEKVTAEKIIIAVGGRPNMHEALPGSEYCISSNEAFDLAELPKSIAIEGGGYIAVEFANIFHGLGVPTTLIYRGKEILGRFDGDMRRGLHEAMEAKGIRIVCQDVITRLDKRSDGHLNVTLKSGEESVFDKVMLARGRMRNTERLALEAAGVETGVKVEIFVDESSRPNVVNIGALGDVTDRVQLTPVAIHEAMCLIETEFKNNPTPVDHQDIATAVFSQPELGTVGLSEEEACKRYEELEIYRASFRPMRNTLAGRDEKMIMKLVVDASSRRVVGAHILGPDAGEMAQILGITI